MMFWAGTHALVTMHLATTPCHKDQACGDQGSWCIEKVAIPNLLALNYSVLSCLNNRTYILTYITILIYNLHTYIYHNTYI